MSYVLDQPAATGQHRRRRWPWIVAAVLVMALVATTAFLLGRSHQQPSSQPPPATAPQQPQGQPTSELGTLRWETIAGSPVPISKQHGPHTISPKGVGIGYTHDKAGAVMAMINISSRMASSAPPSMWRATVRQSTYGDQQTMLSTLARQTSSTPPAQTRIQQYWYAIEAGDPTGDIVQVSMIGRTPQTAQMGGYAKLTRTLSWRDGTWKMQVPVSDPQLVSTTAGHTAVPMPRR